MRGSIRTQQRLTRPKRRRRRKKPSARQQLRVEWLRWLIDTYGADAVAEWQEAPVSFEEWCRIRSLEAHEAA